MSKMMWGGRFEAAPHPTLLDLTESITTDFRLLPYDVIATKAHARSLVAAGLLEPDRLADVDLVCDELLGEWLEGNVDVSSADEDVHTLVERWLTDRLGETGARIHAGRSRNDLVATDLRLWCRDAAAECAALVSRLVTKIADLAEEHSATVMPGYTHLQRAQAVSLGFHLAAHGFALLRDGDRFVAAGAAAEVSTLGAGALAGTTLPLDPSIAARELEFEKTFDNAMDAVSDRDFACDLAYAAALCGVHLSRLGEEIVLWTTAEFGFARLSDEWSTGSSMMPQKRNPDLAELVRGRSAAAIADLTGLLTLLKGLPLAYDRDLQEDKGFLFGSVDRVHRGLRAVDGLLDALEFDVAAMAQAAAQSGTWATDVAEALVARGLPFREAHRVVGALVGDLSARGLVLEDANEEVLASHHSLLPGLDTARLRDPATGIRTRSNAGGTGPDRVREQAQALRARAGALRT